MPKEHCEKGGGSQRACVWRPRRCAESVTCAYGNFGR